jgi:DNA-binding LytR/AlgR family response regulator
MQFEDMRFCGYAVNYDDALNLILEQQPSLVFLEINPLKVENALSLGLINELYRYLTVIPKFVITTTSQNLVMKALEHGVQDYLMKPMVISDFRKSVLKFQKSVQYTQTVSASTVEAVNSTSQSTIDEPQTFKEEEIELIKEEITLPTENVAEEVIQKQEVDEAVTNTESIIIEETTIDEAKNVIESETEQAINEIETEDVEIDNQLAEQTVIDTENNIQTVEIENTVSTTTEPVTEATIENTELENLDNTNEVSIEKDDEVQFISAKNIIVKQEEPLIICIKSYGDYRYIDSRDIVYLEADSNSTDIHLKDGEVITAFKTLKHFENVLPAIQFLRIHNSYIINVKEVARIHTGNSVCFIKNSTLKLPFSKSYKENIDLLIHRIASGNYIEV